MTNNNIADLQNMDLGKMLIDEDLSKYTTYKVGGKAKVLVFPENKEKLLELLKYIKENNIKYFVMGMVQIYLFRLKYLMELLLN